MSDHDGAASGRPDAVAALLRGRLAGGDVELPVKGTSMAGLIESGATVVLTEASQPRTGEIWAFVDDDGGIVVHRVREYDGANVTGRGSGNSVDDEPVPSSRLIGRVTAARNHGRHRVFGEVDRVRASVAMRSRRRIRRLLRGLSRTTWPRERRGSAPSRRSRQLDQKNRHGE